MIIYYGETIRIRNMITNFAGAGIAPDSHLIEVYDPSGVQSGADMVAPTQDGVTGSYYQDFIVPAAGPSGFWRAVWKVVVGGQNGYGVLIFEVKSQLGV